MAKRQRDAGLEAMWRCGDVAMWRCGDVAMWRERVERQAASGLGVRAFCPREGFSETNFHAWRWELRLRDRELVAVSEQPQPTFVPAVITTEKPDDPAVLLTVALDGALHVNVSVERLADLVIALRQRGV
jgi:hypothetical protein